MAVVNTGSAPGVRPVLSGAEMNVEEWPVSALKPYEGNPRINDHVVDAVAASIRQYGFRQPIVVDRAGVILCGHTRWKAAARLGLGGVPVIVARALTDEQARAYRIVDNRTAELAEWDFEKLAAELQSLQDAGVDLSSIGMSADEVTAAIERGAPASAEDLENAIPPAPLNPSSKRGDLYQLGTHRLLCGDSGSVADVDRLLSGGAVHMVNTDPPYNVKVEPRSNNAIAAGNSSFPEAKKRTHHQSFDVARQGEKKATTNKMRAKDRPLANDFVADDEFDRLLAAWFGNIARVLVPGGGFYIWGGYANCANYPPVLKACELYFSQAIIWIKEHPVLTRKDFMGNHEWCFYGWREGGAHRWFGPANVPDTWSIKKISPQSMVHLTEKPVELAARAIQYSSQPGETVLDLFGGSGSTLIACEQLGRRAHLVEMDEAYCDVIVARWEKFTGHKAELMPAESAAAAQSAKPQRQKRKKRTADEAVST